VVYTVQSIQSGTLNAVVLLGHRPISQCIYRLRDFDPYLNSSFQRKVFVPQAGYVIKVWKFATAQLNSPRNNQKMINDRTHRNAQNLLEFLQSTLKCQQIENENH
jgi:hypothetical protein